MEVEINGSRFKLLLKLWNDRKLSAMSKWNKSFWKFPSDETVHNGPIVVDKAVSEAEVSIAILQTLQAIYNIETEVKCDGVAMPLLQAIKTIGGMGRREKRWSGASRDENDTTRRMRRYEIELHNSPRDTDKEYPEQTIDQEAVEAKSLSATKAAALLREAIAKGNGKTRIMEIPDGLLIDGQ